MFGLFKAKPETHYCRLDDLVWQTAPVRQQQLLARARQLALDGTHTMLCSHSLITLGNLRQVLGKDSEQLCLADAARVSAASLLQWLAPAKPLRLMVAEFGATAADDEQLLQRINDPRLKNLTVEFHVSLDDAALKSIVSPQLRQILQQLGLKPDEPIQHRYVTRAIANARSKKP